MNTIVGLDGLKTGISLLLKQYLEDSNSRHSKQPIPTYKISQSLVEQCGRISFLHVTRKPGTRRK